MRKIDAILISIVCLLFFVFSCSSDEKPINTSYVTADGEKVLRHEIIVNAPLQEVWRAFTTTEGLKEWRTPTVRIDFQRGGKLYQHFRKGATLQDDDTIINNILSYLPMVMISFDVPTHLVNPMVGEENRLWSVIQFKELGKNRVQVVESVLGWREGTEWDKAYAFFERGNAFLLNCLQTRFATGPTDWSERN